MKIDVKNLRGDVSFETLDNGDVFDYEGSGDTLWMKMECMDEHGLNAVALDDGSITRFGDGEKVYVVNVKLVNA